MKIQFVTDSIYPNNWVMRKSAILKAQGHDCSLVHEDPDKVFISCVFKKNADQYRGVAQFYRMQGIEVVCGGTGFNLDLDPEVDTVMPDYDLYPSTYSMGFCTRGCPRNCHFCMVTQKEGAKVQRVQHIKDFHNQDHDTVMLLDSNILFDKEWFFKNTDYVLDNDLTIWEHGLDVRMVDPEIADRLHELKFKGGMPKFAFDHTRDEKHIVEGMKLLKDHHVKGNFYVYCHDESCIPDAIYRKEVIQSCGHDWHVMTNQEVPQTKTLKKFKRWGSRPAISRSHPFGVTA
jgi:hypothetical protein